MSDKLKSRPHKWGSGSVEEYSPGKFRVRVRIDGKPTTIASGLTKAAAERYREAFAADKEGPDALTFGTMVELARIERQRRGDLKYSTLQSEQPLLTHIGKALGHIPIADVDVKDIRDYLKQAASTSTQKNRLNMIRYVLQLAVDDETIKVNVANSVKLKRQAAVKLRKSDLLQQILWPAQQQKIIDKLVDPGRLRLSEREELDVLRRELLLAAYLFALGTGCRLSEQWGVKRADVSADSILICRSVGNERPKSGDYRELPILPPTAAALRVHANLCRRSARIARSEWLFPGELGAQRTFRKPPKGWSETLRSAGIGHRRWHWLRHACGTALVAGWWGEAWSLEQVRAMLGHASVTTTEIYARLLDDAAFKAAEKSFGGGRKRDLGKVDFDAVQGLPLPASRVTDGPRQELTPTRAQALRAAAAKRRLTPAQVNFVVESKARGESQKAIAEILGVSPSTVSEVLSGRLYSELTGIEFKARTRKERT